MKKMLMAFVLLGSFAAHANDGGMAYIEVKGINPIPKVDSYGTQLLEVYGKGTEQFMSILPVSFSVAQAFVPNYAENFRSIALVSNGYVLTINCAGGELVSDGNGNFSIQKFADGPRCTVVNSRRSRGDSLEDYLGDATEFNKDQMVCERP